MNVAGEYCLLCPEAATLAREYTSNVIYYAKNGDEWVLVNYIIISPFINCRLSSIQAKIFGNIFLNPLATKEIVSFVCLAMN